MTDNTTLVAQGAADAAFSVDQTRLYVSTQNGDILVFDLATKSQIAIWHVGTSLGAVSVAEDGSYLLVAERDATDGNSTLYRVDTGSGLAETLSIPGSAFADIEIVDATTAILTGGQQKVTVLNLNNNSFSTLDNAVYYSNNSVMVEDGHYTLLAEGGISNGPLLIYDDQSHQIVAEGDDYQSPVTGFNFGSTAISQEAGLVAQFIYYGSINIYDINLNYMQTLAVSGPVDGITFDTEGNYMYVYEISLGKVVKFEVGTWEQVDEYAVGTSNWHNNQGFGNQLLVSDSGEFLTVMGYDGSGDLHLIDISESNSDDTITGTPGDDTIRGGGGDDTIFGDAGNDTLIGNTGSDSLDGGEGNDIIYSGNVVIRDIPGQPPLLDHGPEVDTLIGGNGNDTIYAGYGDNVDGGAGSDSLIISFQAADTGVTADFSLGTITVGVGIITSIENVAYVEGSNFDDYINANTGQPFFGMTTSDSPIYGMAGNDTLIAGQNTSLLDGGDGNDILDGRATFYLRELNGGAGDDIIHTKTDGIATANGGDGDDTIYAPGGVAYGGSGNDIINLAGSFYGAEAHGDGGDDTLSGSDGSDDLYGGAGSDIIDGGAKADDLYSADFAYPYLGDYGAEHDVLRGGTGNDRLTIGFGDDADGGDGTDTLRLTLAGSATGVTLDTISFRAGASATIGGGTIQNVEQVQILTGSSFGDHLTIAAQAIAITVNGDAGDDWVASQADHATIRGGDGNDRIDSYGLDAVIFGDDGNDAIYVEAGTVRAYGGYGEDFFFSGAGADTFDGQYGNDHVAYSFSAVGVTANLSTGVAPGGDQLISIESLDGSNFADSLTGDFQANHLYGAGGNDTLIGLEGNDVLDGGTGNDTMQGGAGNDLYIVDSTRDVVTELSGQGTDEVHATVNYTLGSNVENGVLDGEAVSLTGNTLNNELRGNNFANTLSGGNGNDVLDGMGGADTLIGGAGNDIFIVDNAADVVTEGSRGGTDEVVAIVSYALTANSEIERLSSINGYAVNLTGNSLAQAIVGTDMQNVIAGLGGNDTLTGGGGNDTFLFGTGGGKDQITDFSTGDILQISGYTAAQSIVQSGSNVIVTLSALDIITLQNTDLATVQAGIQFDSGGGGGGGGTPGGPTEGDDTLTGTTRGDTINGLGGNDTILGLAGSDKLLGGEGNDTLRGGAGADTLTGGSGADLFVFETGGNNDKVLDFVSGTDKIDLHLLSGVTSADIKTALSNGNTVVSVDADHNGKADFTITLTGVTHVDTGDFIFA